MIRRNNSGIFLKILILLLVLAATGCAPQHPTAGNTSNARNIILQHTPADVPLTAMGPAAEHLNGAHDNTFLYDVMDQALSD